MRNKGRSGDRLFGAGTVVLAMFFLVGAAVGSYFAANLPLSGGGYMQSYISAAPSVSLRALALELGLMAAVFVSAFFPRGFFVPVLALCVKGFMLSMLITSFVGAFGAVGFFAALPALLLSGFVPVMCLVLLSRLALSLSLERLRAGRSARVPVDRAFYLAGSLCAAAAAASVALHLYLTPILSRAAVSM